jgi:hypothetical protein
MPCRILKAYMQEMEKLDLSPPASPDALQYRPVSLEGPRLLGLVGWNVETSISTTHRLEVGNVPILQVSNSEDPLLRCNERKAKLVILGRHPCLLTWAPRTRKHAGDESDDAFSEIAGHGKDLPGLCHATSMESGLFPSPNVLFPCGN